jgi:uncharacterized membrane protein YbjE (DUF340 family)
VKNSLIILAFFVLGILCGLLSLLPEFMRKTDFSLYALYALLFLVGVAIGSDERTWRILRSANVKILLVPLSVIVGSFAGVMLFSLLLPSLSLRESLAIGSGFGYYSLSSVLITRLSGETLGVIALLSNIIREIITLSMTPIFARYLGNLAPIASGGATTMDTTLPIITKFVGKEYAMIAVFSGMVLTMLVPFLVTFILKA